MRDEWAKRCNAALARAGSTARVVHRSNGWVVDQSGGTGGLWYAPAIGSRTRELVVTESGIDAMSYAQAQGIWPDHRAYCSTGGGIGERVIAAIIAFARRLGALLCLAQDADPAGDAMAQRISAAADPAGVAWRRDRPPTEGGDWSDVVQAAAPPAIPDEAQPEVEADDEEEIRL